MRPTVSIAIAALPLIFHATPAVPAIPDERVPALQVPNAAAIRDVSHRQAAESGENRLLEAVLLWVMDGDSLRARIAGKQVELRLGDIDAPEHDQAYGWEAKLALIDLVRGRRLIVAPREVDRHGRTVARVWAGEIDVSRELVAAGAAWFYTPYAQDETLRQQELHARAAKRGLWAMDGPHVEPWLWRKRQSDASTPRRAPRSGAERRTSAM